MSENNIDSQKEPEILARTIKTISREEARRAIYIDFESNPDWVSRSSRTFRAMWKVKDCRVISTESRCCPV